MCKLSSNNRYISYTSLYQPTPHRRNELREMYFFDCNCERCQSYVTDSGTATLDADAVMTGLCKTAILPTV